MSGKKRKLLEVMTQLDLFADEQDLQPAPVENARIGYYFYPGLEPEFYKQVRDENGYWRCEEKILRLHEMKRKISDDILTGTAQTSKLSYEDVKELVSSF